MSTMRINEETKARLRRIGGKTYEDSVNILLERAPTDQEIEQRKADEDMSKWVTSPSASINRQTPKQW